MKGPRPRPLDDGDVCTGVLICNDTSMLSTFLARTALLCAAFFFFSVMPAHAQLEKQIAVGVSVANFEPASEELNSEVRIVPTVSRVPRPGLGLALALNWYATDVNDVVLRDDDPIAKLRVRPFMAGVGYTVMRGAFSITPSIVAGPAWNKVEVDDDVRDLFFFRKTDEDEDFGPDATTWTFVVRPGVSATYAVTPRFGITGFAGYVFNRPKFDTITAFNVAPSRVSWNGDGLALSAGVVVPVF